LDESSDVEIEDGIILTVWKSGSDEGNGHAEAAQMHHRQTEME